jgi:hypothetical protein
MLIMVNWPGCHLQRFLFPQVEELCKFYRKHIRFYLPDIALGYLLGLCRLQLPHGLLLLMAIPPRCP